MSEYKRTHFTILFAIKPGFHLDREYCKHIKPTHLNVNLDNH